MRLTSRAGQRRGVVKSLKVRQAQNRCPSHRQVFFLLSAFSDRWSEATGIGEQIEAVRAAGAFARRNTAPHRLHSLASPIWALSRRGFAIMHGGLISGGIFSHFPDGFLEAMIYKGTMGTREQAMSDRQKAAPPERASLFPSPLTVLGTWEQKWPIPRQENPRACGSPLPPPAGGRD